MARLSELRRFLLSLIGPRADTAMAGNLGREDWRAVDTMAAQHRIQPWLHAQCERGLLAVTPPVTIREGWRQTHRGTALRALAMRKDLLEANAILARSGIAAVALKGAWCAWHAYPAAAERPMRDIDLLVPEQKALEAFSLLFKHGFRQEEASARTPEQSLGHDKHLPPMLSPQGHRFELHMRLWEREQAIGWMMPEDISADIHARGRQTSDDPISYLAPEDMLAHLVVHGVYSNRLNGGPLTLLDVRYFLESAAIDWPGFWRTAAECGWARGGALLLALVDRWCGAQWTKLSACPFAVDSSLIDAAPALLLQDLDQRKAVGLAASLSIKPGTAVRRLRGPDRARQTGYAAPTNAESGLAWLTRRLHESGKALAKRDVRKVASETVRLGHWLESEGE